MTERITHRSAGQAAAAVLRHFTEGSPRKSVANALQADPSTDLAAAAAVKLAAALYATLMATGTDPEIIFRKLGTIGQ